MSEVIVRTMKFTNYPGLSAPHIWPSWLTVCIINTDVELNIELNLTPETKLSALDFEQYLLQFY